MLILFQFKVTPSGNQDTVVLLSLTQTDKTFSENYDTNVINYFLVAGDDQEIINKALEKFKAQYKEGKEFLVNRGTKAGDYEAVKLMTDILKQANSSLIITLKDTYNTYATSRNLLFGLAVVGGVSAAFLYKKNGMGNN